MGDVWHWWYFGAVLVVKLATFCGVRGSRDILGKEHKTALTETYGS
jgi:hypothetical protein